MIRRLGNVDASVSRRVCHYGHKTQLGPCLAIKVCTSLVIITFAVAQRGDEFPALPLRRCQESKTHQLRRGAEGTPALESHLSSILFFLSTLFSPLSLCHRSLYINPPSAGVGTGSKSEALEQDKEQMHSG